MISEVQIYEYEKYADCPSGRDPYRNSLYDGNKRYVLLMN